MATQRYHAVEGGKIRIRVDAARELVERKYGVYGHGTVELCKWTKEALTGGPSCYKVKFYNAPAGGSHRCVEMSPVGLLCDNRCVYCWRPTEEFDFYVPSNGEVLDPEELVEGILRERRRLLSGYYGHPRSGRKKVEEALRPTHWAISLSGEPTLYPKLPRLIRHLLSLPHTRSVFLVTNGQHPEMLRRLAEEGALPTQLYLSTNAPDRDLFYRVNVPVGYREDAWERWLESLKIISELPTRTVMRITLIRSLNFEAKHIPGFARLVAMGNPHFVEVKSYMHLGRSTLRLKKSDMLEHGEVREWAMSLLEELSRLGKRFTYMDEEPRSRIAVLQNMERYVDRWIVKPGTL